MLLGTVPLFSLPSRRRRKKARRALVVVSTLCVFGTLALPVHADTPKGDEPQPKSTVRGNFNGDAFVVEKTSFFSIKGITSATDSVRQNLLMVPELMEQAKAIAQVPEDAPALVALWQAQCAVGDTDGAKQTLEAAREIAKGKQSGYSQPIPLCVIAEAQAQAGDKKGAQASLTEALLLVDTNLSPRRKVEFLDEIAQAQIKLGDAEAIKSSLAAEQRIAEAMPASDDKDAALFKIACLQGALGDSPGAKNTAGTIQSAQYKVFFLCFNADERLKAGDTAGAKMSLASALQVTAPSQNGYSYQLQEIAQVQANMGDFTGAKATANKINLVDTAYLKHRVFLFVVQAQAKNGDINGAKTSAALIPDNRESKVDALCAIGQGQAKHGDLAGAKATFARAKQLAETAGYVDGPAWEYLLIADAEIKMGLFADAKSSIAKIDDARARTGVLARLVTAIVDDAKKQSATITKAKGKTK